MTAFLEKDYEGAVVYYKRGLDCLKEDGQVNSNYYLLPECARGLEMAQRCLEGQKRQQAKNYKKQRPPTLTASV